MAAGRAGGADAIADRVARCVILRRAGYLIPMDWNPSLIWRIGLFLGVMRMNIEKNRQRALRYRKLALAEPDRDKADLLNQIADEAERGILCTADHQPSINKTPGTVSAH